MGRCLGRGGIQPMLLQSRLVLEGPKGEQEQKCGGDVCKMERTGLVTLLPVSRGPGSAVGTISGSTE